MHSTFDPLFEFPEFYENEHIKLLGTQERWTISTNTKMPLDIQHLLTTGRVRGAFDVSEQCLITLNRLTTAIPEAANAAYYLRAAQDGYIVIDIEPSCPIGVASELLSIPGALYLEHSMSGRGYHILMPLPKNFDDYPIAVEKRVLRHPEGWWEILLDHWVTFTRKPVHPERLAWMHAAAWPALHVQDPSYVPSLESVWASLASQAVETPSLAIDFSELEPEIPGKASMLAATTMKALPRSLADFGNDSSRYEFSVMSTLYLRMINAERVYFTAIGRMASVTQLDDNQRSWLLYLAAQQVLEYRDKHDETRNGRPYLLEQAVNLVSMRAAQAAFEQASSTNS